MSHDFHIIINGKSIYRINDEGGHQHVAHIDIDMIQRFDFSFLLLHRLTVT